MSIGMSTKTVNGQRSTDNGQRPFIPYARQWIEEDDIQTVVEILSSDWLTTGPKVSEFEQAVADFVGTEKAVAVSSGTAALHAAMYAIGIKPGDEVILPPMTFVSTANAVIFQGGIPVFADVDPKTLLINPGEVETKLTQRTKAIIAVDYAGHPCDYDSLQDIANRHNLILIADACHALGARYKDKQVGSLADLNIFSLHPAKHITTGEGGMVTTDNADFTNQMTVFRNHGITTDHHQREKQGSWFYEMVDLGYNYRLSDIQCALGISQLQKLSIFLERRREIAGYYDSAFAKIPEITPLDVKKNVFHAYHLYVIKADFAALGTDRSRFFLSLRERGIGVNVHYIPVHLHAYYRKKLQIGPGLCPVAESAYEQIISLPLFPAMTDGDVEKVITSITEITTK